MFINNFILEKIYEKKRKKNIAFECGISNLLISHLTRTKRSYILRL